MPNRPNVGDLVYYINQSAPVSDAREGLGRVIRWSKVTRSEAGYKLMVQDLVDGSERFPTRVFLTYEEALAALISRLWSRIATRDRQIAQARRERDALHTLLEQAKGEKEKNR